MKVDIKLPWLIKNIFIGCVMSSCSMLISCSTTRIPEEQAATLVHGYVAPGFEEVQKQFVKNFSERGELGAAVAVYYKGQKVVDLWGGYRNAETKELWEEHSMIVVFSTTKGMAAMTAAVANSQGILDYDAKVTDYWKEFGQQGKENITVRQLLCHSAGLVDFDDDLPVAMMGNLDSVGSFLARQKPEWTPGEYWGYHSSTLGLYLNELLRHADKQHRSIGRFFQEEIARPLGVEFYIGLPDSIPNSRLATIEMINPASGIFHLFDLPSAVAMRMLSPWSYLMKSFSVPKGYEPNIRSCLAIELPSGNGVGEVRAIAAVYGEFASGGKRLGIKQHTLNEVAARPVLPSRGNDDKVLGISSYYLLGFSKPGPDVRFGSSETAFGTPGAGGSFGFADPDKQIGYAYAMTKMGYYLDNDPRELALRTSVYACISAIEQRISQAK